MPVCNAGAVGTDNHSAGASPPGGYQYLHWLIALRADIVDQTEADKRTGVTKPVLLVLAHEEVPSSPNSSSAVLYRKAWTRASC